MALLVLGLLALASATYFLGELMTEPAQERRGSMRRAHTYGRLNQPVHIADESLRDRTLMPLKEKVARLVLRANPKWTVDKVSLRLLSAGLGRRISPTGFLAAKGLFLVGGIVFGVAVGGALGGGMSSLLFMVAIAGAGFIGPDFYINWRIKSRREQIRAQLPDALDLLAVSVEAGLGFDGALQKITEQMDGPLIEEFTLTLGEMRIGETRQEALKKFSERVNAPEVSAFVRSIIQADQFGISLGRILKVQAADTRLRRQAAAEERAMKAPIKMLFPTVIFIFPAMFLVILGPAFLNLSKII
jgi:tight adherence protein C